MVRAATTGAIDFSQFDSADSWWWQRLRWTLHELAAQQRREFSVVQHRHWLGLMAVPGLQEESWDNANTNASDALQRLADNYYPWLKDRAAATPAMSARDQLIAQYREQYGSPGEEKHDRMVKENLKMWQNPPSIAEKLRRRRERRASQEQSVL